ncbi:MoaD/ThiS family protein [Chloroflexota bacterium]
MRIKLESMFGVFGIDLVKTFGGDQVELDGDSITLKDFLVVLTEQGGNTIRFVDVGGESVADDYFVLLNGNEVKSLKEGLDTNLSDGDVVGIGPVDLLFSGG